ncbi:hypothetical protein NECAME_09580 [Necator americanus]|uniref:Methyltransferase domain-containing protein n=1 Tax=Necator americanus TaxID=51031 RepID=W2TCR2_NECAM|nr:hypothetical protein NECAME_09580 [Necator americanus]ETN79825.1 hypothetical protein NECAME_09580 [Necator americanus]
MGVADVITVTEDEKFFIKKENVEDLTGGSAIHFISFLPIFMRGYDKIINVFKKEGPLGIKDDGQTYENLAFIQINVAKMDDDWTDKFDIVTIFDACHDQMRPDLCLKEIHRVLKPGGVFGMLEVDSTSNVFKDKQEKGITAAQMYGSSMFHCLPVGSNSEDALALGAMWGRERAVKMLEDAGFSNITVKPTPQFEQNVLYVCSKD